MIKDMTKTAFPVHSQIIGVDRHGELEVQGSNTIYCGMSLRQWYAGMVISPCIGMFEKEQAVKYAFEVADEMIKQGDK